MAKALSALLGGFLLVTSQTASARVLDLPLYDPARGLDRAPGYAPDRIEVTLTRAAARQLPLHARSWRRLGLRGIDAAADEMGVLSFEREFPEEELPADGEPDFTRYLIVRLPPGADVARVLDRLAALPMVERVDPIGIMPVNRVPNDSLYASSYWYDRIHAPQAWDVTVGDPSILIAIVDTGVLPWHPDIGGTQAGGFGNLWVNQAELSGQVNRDDDGNGYVDDVWGWDFVSGVTGSAAPCEDADIPDNDPSDFDGHGTMLAGLVAGLTNNTIGVAGGTWNCRIMALRAGWRGNTGGFVAMDFCAQAIRYATRMGAHVINCSWSSSNTGGLGAAVYAAVRSGIVVTVAAGNNGATALYLQQRADCIDVSATDSQDRVPRGGSPWFWMANVGPEVDLCAPGDNITSTFTLGLTATPCASQPRVATYSQLDGTSFSAPLVASAAAMVQSYRRQQGLKLLTPQSMRLRLMETADDISAQNPGLTGFGAGRLNVFRALTDPPSSWADRLTSIPAPGVVVLPSTSGKARLAFVTSDRHLLILSGVAGDTLLDVSVPAVPTTGLSASTLGPNGEVVLFFGGRNGRAYGYHLDGTPLTNWPRIASGAFLVFGPALADLDGDGIPEAVFTGDDGDVYAWHVDGSVVAGFPVSTGSTFSDGPALADLDGDGKAEVVAAATDGQLWVWEGDGNLRAGGWPVALGGSSPPAPVIGRITAGGAPAIVVGDGIGNVSAFDQTGAMMSGWPVNLGSAVVYGLALGNVVGDSLPEIVAPTASQVFILTGTGSQASPPISPGASVRGAPGLADVTGDGLADILFTAGRVIVAYRGTGSAIAGWGRRAGDYMTGLNYFVVPTAGDFDGDGRTEVWAGADTTLIPEASDTTLYCYDAGPSSYTAAGMAWATARGNAARTGALGVPALPALDDVAPAAVLNLDAVGATDTTVTLTWTAVGNDGLNGTASSYDLRYSTGPINESNFASAAAVGNLGSPKASGSPETADVRGLASGTRYYFGLRVRDQAGNASPLSNVADTTTTGSPGPLAGTVGPALRVAPHPARGQVNFYYRGDASTPGVQNRIEIYDLTGRRIQRLEQGTRVEGSFIWNGKDAAGSLVPAGVYFARLVSGSSSVKTRVVWMP